MTVSLLPPNATNVEKSIELAVAKQMEALSVENIYNQWDSQKCPPHILGWLAWAVSVDDWNPEWPEQVKRNVIAETVEVHRFKGSRYSVKKALSTIGVKTQLIESRSEPETMVPFSFKVKALANGEASHSDVVINQQLYDDIRRRLNNVKPQRSQFSLEVGASTQQQLSMATTTQSAMFMRDRVSTTVKPIKRQTTPTIANVFHSVNVLRITMEAA